MKWKIKNKVYNLPFKTKKEVLKFINQDFKICPYCRKIDCSLEHISECNPEIANYENMRQDNLWK